MSIVAIPQWNLQGVLPPIYPGEPASSRFRSPFLVSLLDLVLRFSDTPERRRILGGFLDYRKELHNIGLKSGFQWINGSFSENVESLRGQPPRDIDVVTFIDMPNGGTERNLLTQYPDLFNSDAVKQKYHTDAYSVFLGTGYPERYIIERSTYWYSLWSHQRQTAIWKGFLQIDLAPLQDDDAKRNLLTAQTEGGEL